MITRIKKSKKEFAIGALGVLVALTLVPLAAHAYSAPNIFPTGFWGPIVTCTGDYTGQTTSGGPGNPCVSICDLIATIVNLIYFGMSIALFVLAPISFVAGGIMYMISGGNPSKAQNAKKVLIGVVIGVVIILLSYFIINLFVNIITNNTGLFGSATC